MGPHGHRRLRGYRPAVERSSLNNLSPLNINKQNLTPKAGTSKDISL